MRPRTWRRLGTRFRRGPARQTRSGGVPGGERYRRRISAGELHARRLWRAQDVRAPSAGRAERASGHRDRSSAAAGRLSQNQDPLPARAQFRGAEIKEKDLPLVAYGDMLFDSPLIFGEPARSLGLACSTCHNRSDVNQAFFIPGISHQKGAIDVAALLQSALQRLPRGASTFPRCAACASPGRMAVTAASAAARLHPQRHRQRVRRPRADALHARCAGGLHARVRLPAAEVPSRRHAQRSAPAAAAAQLFRQAVPADGRQGLRHLPHPRLTFPRPAGARHRLGRPSYQGGATAPSTRRRCSRAYSRRPISTTARSDARRRGGLVRRPLRAGADRGREGGPHRLSRGGR